MFFKGKLDYFCVVDELQRNHYLMRQLLALYFLVHLLLNQVVLNVLYQERRTSPLMEVAIELDQYCGFVGK